MENHFLYILYSKSADKFYIGESKDVNKRLEIHNLHSMKGAFTKIANDWEVKVIFECNNKNEALFIEKFIKKMKSRSFILKIIETPKILSEILSKMN
ncbi:GIY-YIG nuclease family protein [Polaribacter gangjinensis]|uniref:Excinuclease ABC subunit C n=1 Tax=Polaribacter gangjinensis TaxID=574710 RepID=A0A2S7WEC9_9FLAO|nr:GIY-YIG nuclease family protein [Polaribacter gangjinensis]PQJ75989.1 excinuclease ABC subunit C [Polaribacter gangjinensis]